MRNVIIQYIGRESRHIASLKESPIRFNDKYVTLCGRLISKARVKVEPEDTTWYQKRKSSLCGTCLHVRSTTHDLDLVEPKPNDAATRRGTALSGAVRVVQATVWRVQGSTDTYTVTIPHEPDLSALCNCMAAKVNPDKQCKHMVAVLEYATDQFKKAVSA